MDELHQILINSKVTKEQIEANLISSVSGSKTELKPREVFDEISEIADSYFNHQSILRMVGLAGLRGVGKTTLLWQSAYYIRKNYTENIYFFHMADLKNYNIGVREIHKGFEKYFANEKLWSYNERIVFLFDEVHEDENWASDLKILYDLFLKVFVIATGSSALLLQSTADLVTRMLIQHVFPLNFREYIGFSQISTVKFEERQKLQDVLLTSGNVSDLFANLKEIKPDIDNYFAKIKNIDKNISDYIIYHNIIRFSFEQNKELINRLILDLIRRVIYEDIPKMNDGVNVKYSEKILRRLAASDEVNIQTLSHAIGIPQKEIIENLNILEKAELLNALYPFGGIDTKINKSQKYFFMSPSIRRVLLRPFLNESRNDEIYAKLLEDTVVMYLKRIFRMDSVLSFSSQKGNKNPDIIIETLPDPIIMEVGIGKRTSKQITTSKIKYKYRIIISSKTNEISCNEENRIIFLPLKYFLLL